MLTLRGPTGPRRGDAMRDLGLIEDGSLLIVNGIIESVGPTRRIENLAQAKSAEEINAAGRVVLPGFVDSHTHLVAPPARTSEFRIGPVQRLIPEPRLREARAHLVQYVRTTTARMLEHHARRYLEAALRHGTTTLEAKTGYGLNPPAELKMLRVLAALGGKGLSLVPTYLGAHFPPPDWEHSPEHYIESVASAMIPRIAARRLAQFADVVCGPHGFTPEQSRPYLQTARRAGLGLKIHSQQFAHDSSVELAVELEATTVDGLNFADESDAQKLARSRTVATLLPASVHSGAQARFPPARALIDSGAAVALASGFHPVKNSTFNMQMVISLACTHMDMTPEEALSAATINGAHALLRASRCGSLEFGKEADLLILNASDYREIAYYIGTNAVALVMRGGEVVYREGAITCAAE